MEQHLVAGVVEFGGVFWVSDERRVLPFVPILERLDDEFDFAGSSIDLVQFGVEYDPDGGGETAHLVARLDLALDPFEVDPRFVLFGEHGFLCQTEEQCVDRGV